MKKLIFTFFALISIIIGWSLKDRGGLAMHITSSGEVLYPISSGSEDGTFIFLGLISFILTFSYSIASLILKHKLKTLIKVYLVNLVFLLMLIALVSLDSSIILAAKLGDDVPLIGVIISFIPLILIIINQLKREHE